MNDADIAVGTTTFQDAADLGAEWALAGYDVRAQARARRRLGDCRSSRDSTSLTSKVLGGWQIAGSAIFQSGNPINITRGGSFPSGDYNADGNGGDRPNTPRGEIKTEWMEPGGVPRRHLQGDGFPGAGGLAPTAISFATPIADPATPT